MVQVSVVSLLLVSRWFIYNRATYFSLYFVFKDFQVFLCLFGCCLNFSTIRDIWSFDSLVQFYFCFSSYHTGPLEFRLCVKWLLNCIYSNTYFLWPVLLSTFWSCSQVSKIDTSFIDQVLQLVGVFYIPNEFYYLYYLNIDF